MQIYIGIKLWVELCSRSCRRRRKGGTWITYFRKQASRAGDSILKQKCSNRPICVIPKILMRLRLLAGCCSPTSHHPLYSVYSLVSIDFVVVVRDDERKPRMDFDSLANLFSTSHHPLLCLVPSIMCVRRIKYDIWAPLWLLPLFAPLIMNILTSPGD